MTKDPMDTVRSTIGNTKLVKLIEGKLSSSQWLWSEDPYAEGIWAIVEGETKTVLAIVYTNDEEVDEDTEVSDRLLEMLEECK